MKTKQSDYPHWLHHVTVLERDFDDVSYDDVFEAVSRGESIGANEGGHDFCDGAIWRLEGIAA